MTTGERLAELRKKRSLSQKAFADIFGVSQSTVTMWENNKRRIGNDDLIKLADFYHVSSDYILARSDDKIPLTKQTPIVATEKIPVYGSIRAGMPTLAVENIIGRVWVPIDVQERYGRENLFALRINGESMNKVIPNGYAAVFAKGVGVENGDIVAVLIDGEDATIKRFEQTSQAAIFSPESWDETFKPIIFHKTEVQDFKIMGKYLFATSAEI